MRSGEFVEHVIDYCRALLVRSCCRQGPVLFPNGSPVEVVQGWIIKIIADALPDFVKDCKLGLWTGHLGRGRL
jgi:hypothetical protein